MKKVFPATHVVVRKNEVFMEEELHTLRAEDYDKLKPYFIKRDPGICDSMFIDNYMWGDYYNAKYFIDDKAIYWVLNMRGEYFSILPMCSEEDLQYCFDKLVKYFNEVLKEKLRIYIADEGAVNILEFGDEFEVNENRDYFDYVYSGDLLRTLRGKKMHKKKNHLNAFLKQYEGRYEYKKVCCKDKEEIRQFLDRWYSQKESDDIYNRLAQEYNGILKVVEHCKDLEFKMGSVLIDGNMEAFTLGSYSKGKNMAFIHVEKANPEIRGLYNFINQQFLVNEYPEVELVNREDDMGLEGLRAAKLSYRPVYLAKKYSIMQK